MKLKSSINPIYFMVCFAMFFSTISSLKAQEDKVELITVMDTVATFDPTTNKETVVVVKSEIDIHTNPEEKALIRSCMERSIVDKEACSKQKFEDYISKFLDYPEDAKAKGIQGTCEVSFVVNDDGNVTMVNIVKGIRPDMDAAAVKVIQKMNQYFSEEPWAPAYHNGSNVASRMIVPITFKL